MLLEHADHPPVKRGCRGQRCCHTQGNSGQSLLPVFGAFGSSECCTIGTPRAGWLPAWLLQPLASRQCMRRQCQCLAMAVATTFWRVRVCTHHCPVQERRQQPQSDPSLGGEAHASSLTECVLCTEEILRFRLTRHCTTGSTGFRKYLIRADHNVTYCAYLMPAALRSEVQRNPLCA